MKTQPHLQDADGFYEQLLDAHQGLDKEQSELLNARLILILANQVGDAKVLAEWREELKDITIESLPPDMQEKAGFFMRVLSKEPFEVGGVPKV